MFSVDKMNLIKLSRSIRIRNILNSHGIDKFKEDFNNIFGSYEVRIFNGSKYYITSQGIIFCLYSIALSMTKSFGMRSEIILKENLWRIKSNGKWYLICEYFGFLPEEILHKAKKLLRPIKNLYLRWPIEENTDYIIITNGKYAIMIPPEEVNIIREMGS
ncbi:MAG: hypothetical protein ACTSO9_11940 [Candidatus Helarchaeota archaeon]